MALGKPTQLADADIESCRHVSIVSFVALLLFFVTLVSYSSLSPFSVFFFIALYIAYLAASFSNVSQVKSCAHFKFPQKSTSAPDDEWCKLLTQTPVTNANLLLKPSPHRAM
jgi:hypothetical protein